MLASVRRILVAESFRVWQKRRKKGIPVNMRTSGRIAPLFDGSYRAMCIVLAAARHRIED
jgi:hypothetical protein